MNATNEAYEAITAELDECQADGDAEGYAANLAILHDLLQEEGDPLAEVVREVAYVAEFACERGVNAERATIDRGFLWFVEPGPDSPENLDEEIEYEEEIDGELIQGIHVEHRGIGFHGDDSPPCSGVYFGDKRGGRDGWDHLGYYVLTESDEIETHYGWQAVRVTGEEIEGWNAYGDSWSVARTRKDGECDVFVSWT